VNFYTLTFKKKIILAFSLVIFNLIILDIGLYFLAKNKTTKITFIDDKFSKIKHFQLNNSENKDIVFIGSSRTYYHISTNTFKQNGLDIYNFGVSGDQYEDYPTLIPYVNESKPKNIVISLSVNRLFDKLYVGNYPTLDEMKNYYSVDKIKFLSSINTWIVNRHLFLQYSESIYNKIKSVYQKFEPHNKKYNTQNKTNMQSDINYTQITKCNYFDRKDLDNGNISFRCENGDGILIGNNITNKTAKKKYFQKFNRQSIVYLQGIIDAIDTEQIKVLLVLEPILHNQYTYNLDKIKKKFKNIEIIDLTNYKIEDKYWADDTHINNKGKEIYSQHLMTHLKKKL